MEKEITIENLQQEVAELKIENESLRNELEKAKSDYELTNRVWQRADTELSQLKAQVFTLKEILKHIDIEL